VYLVPDASIRKLPAVFHKRRRTSDHRVPFNDGHAFLVKRQPRPAVFFVEPIINRRTLLLHVIVVTLLIFVLHAWVGSGTWTAPARRTLHERGWYDSIENRVVVCQVVPA
jgi:hypothetical protein